MSCLTRKLQQNLARYLKRHSDLLSNQQPESLRNELVSRGLCPSDVTQDQLDAIIKQATSC